MELKELIYSNNFDELKLRLKSSSAELKIHAILFDVLDNQNIEDEYQFDGDRIQEEFLNGFDLYEALVWSLIPAQQLQKYTTVLTYLAFQTGGFVQLLANTAMQKGVNISELESIFKVEPAIRAKLQDFINLLTSNGDIKGVANVAAAKAKITSAIDNLLDKEEVGYDMLQLADSYKAIGHTEPAARMYKSIMNDFECESVQLSTGLFPEITHVDTRSAEEIEIFNTAKESYGFLTGEDVAVPKTVNINSDALAEDQNNAHYNQPENMAGSEENSETSFFKRLKKLFNAK